MKTYKVSVIGTGMIMNGAHIPSIENLKGRFEIVAVADEREEAAKFTAEKLNVPYFTDCREMLEAIDSDILLNCTPNAFHKKYTLLGFEMGRHVICEKPVALSVKDIREILAAADKAGKKFFPAQTGRFTNENMTVKNWIDEGLLGNVYFIDMNIIRRRGIPRWGQFHIKAKNLAGAFADMGVHNVDALLHFTGNPKLISARARMCSPISKINEPVQISNEESGAYNETFVPRTDFSMEDMSVEEFATGVICFENNLTVSFRVAWSMNLQEGSTMSIAGDQGGVALPAMQIYKTVAGCQSVISPKVFDNTSNAISDWGHWVCYEHILADLDGGDAYPVTRDEMINTAAVLEAIYRSAEEDREITFGELEG